MERVVSLVMKSGVNENASGGVDLECGAGFPGDGEDLCVVVGD